MQKQILNYDFVKKLKSKYNYLSMKIDNVINEANKNNLVLSFDDEGNSIILEEKIVLNKEYILSEIASLAPIIEEKEMTDFVYAIQLFFEGNKLIVANTHNKYGTELYKPPAQLLLSIIDFELQKYSFDKGLEKGIKVNIENIFVKILETHNNNNIVLPDRLVLLFAYNFAKLTMMYDNDGSFKKLHSCINRNCIMHNCVFENGKIKIPEVKKEEVLNLIVFYFNVVIFCHSQDIRQMQMITDFISKL